MRWKCLPLLLALILVGAVLPAWAKSTGEPLPAYDALFRRDPRWRGADAAYSVDLGGGRILWLFGDTFVAPPGKPTRAGAAMVRNSLAIQEGLDPATARLTFHLGENEGQPADVFPSPQRDRWLWPGPGLRLGDRLLLSFMVIGPSNDALGFGTVGTTAWLVENPDDPPSRWRHRVLPLPASRHGVAVGVGAWLVDGDDLLAFSPVEPGSHDVWLLRWSLADVRAGNLQNPRWSDAPVFRNGQTEFSVHRRGQEYVAIQVDGFGGTNVAIRRAPRPEGPWTMPEPVYRPAESDRSGILVYSAKAHPWLSPDGVVVSYCTNHLDFATLVGDEALYYPSFVRLTLD